MKFTNLYIIFYPQHHEHGSYIVYNIFKSDYMLVSYMEHTQIS